MSQETKERVFAQLKKFINSADYAGLQKAKPKVAEQIANIKIDDLVLGESATAKFFKGYFNGNVRSEGFRGDYTRTLNFDYTTGTIGFVDDDNTADDDELYYAAHALGMCMYDLGVAKYSHLEQLGSEIYRQDESTLAQIRNVLPLCRREHEKLDFTLRPDTISILECEFINEGSAELHICPVYANVLDKKGRASKLFLGYYIETSDEYTFTINADDLIKKPKKRHNANNDKTIPVGKIIKWLLIVGVITSFVVVMIQMLNP